MNWYLNIFVFLIVIGVLTGLSIWIYQTIVAPTIKSKTEDKKADTTEDKKADTTEDKKADTTVPAVPAVSPVTISLADFQIATIPLSGKDAMCHESRGINWAGNIWNCHPSYDVNSWQNFSLYSDKTIQNSKFPGGCLNQDFSVSPCNDSTNQQWVKSDKNLLTNVGTSSVTTQLIPKTMMTQNMDSTGDITALTDGQNASYCRQLCASTTDCKSSNYVHANGAWGDKSGCVLKTGDISNKYNNTGVDLYTYV